MAQVSIFARNQRWALLGIILFFIGSCSNSVLFDGFGFSESVPEHYRNQSFNIDGSAFHTITAKGLSNIATTSGAMAARISTGTPVVVLHGSNYDIEKTGLDNPHLTIYEVLRTMLKQEDQYSLVGIGWSSVRFTPRNFIEAWSEGLPSPYSLTLRNTAAVVDGLETYLPQIRGPYNLVCHSIGCDILSKALARIDNLPDRILMLSPDTSYKTIHDWAVHNKVSTLHLDAKNDGSLVFSKHAKENSGFVPALDQNTYFRRIVDVEKYAPEWSRSNTVYGNPRRYWDHMATLELQQLWPCYVSFLNLGKTNTC
ncbi:MAG: hypothetical protein AB8B94_06500 [Hyphomicrobiales bacterium]